ncbi:zinc finger protein 182-like [Planococcus citri]|uniref:zinc finger protein 182-like n=1 Tax=Planococcus citri TaxID=170843 RepID=UPI0031F93643
MQPESKTSPEIECIAIFKNTKSTSISKTTSSERYYCNTCGKSFIKKSNLTDHMIEHMYGLPMCHICGQVIPKQEYKNHIKSHVKNKEQFVCGTCNEYFPSKGSLKLHFLRKHTYKKRKPGYKCYECAKTFHNKSVLEVHIKQGHFEMKSFVCDSCQKTFKSYAGLKTHIKSHDADFATTSLYRCNYCEKAYSNKYKLSIHARIHTGEKPHKCDLCGRSFRLRAGLNLHLKSHDKSRPFECEVCKKNFRNKHNLKIHLNTHDGKSYSCQQCERKYRHKDTLVKHIEKCHTAVNCADCGERAEDAAEMKAHMKTHHKSYLRRKETPPEQVNTMNEAFISYQIKPCCVSLTRIDVV